MVNYQVIQPPKALKSLIKYYWVLQESGNDLEYPDLLLPDGCPELIFTFQGYYNRADLDKKRFFQIDRAVVTGVRNHSIFVDSKKAVRTHFIGVKFKPCAITHFFKMNASDLANSVMSIDEMEDNKLGLLYETLADEHDLGSIKHLLSTYFFGKIGFAKSTLTEKRAGYATNFIVKRRGNVKLKELCEVLSVDKRTLSRDFGRYVGIGPKEYAMIIRMNWIYRVFNRSNCKFYDDGVFEYGYYDQSHFLKDFKKYFGMNPSTYYGKINPNLDLFMRNHLFS